MLHGNAGSCISNVDVGSATVKLSEDGTYNLIIGAADMGTGCRYHPGTDGGRTDGLLGG